jgi:hypothetical protein
METAVKRLPKRKDVDSANVKKIVPLYDCLRFVETTSKSCRVTVELPCVYHAKDCNKVLRTVEFVNLQSDRPYYSN